MAVGEIGLVVGLVVRLHHLVARVARDAVYPECSDVEVAADEMEEPICMGRIGWIDVLRHIDVGKADGTERSVARLGHLANLAGRQVKVNAGDAQVAGLGWRERWKAWQLEPVIVPDARAPHGATLDRPLGYVYPLAPCSALVELWPRPAVQNRAGRVSERSAPSSGSVSHGATERT